MKTITFTGEDLLAKAWFIIKLIGLVLLISLASYLPYYMLSKQDWEITITSVSDNEAEFFTFDENTRIISKGYFTLEDDISPGDVLTIKVSRLQLLNDATNVSSIYLELILLVLIVLMLRYSFKIHLEDILDNIKNHTFSLSLPRVKRSKLKEESLVDTLDLLQRTFYALHDSYGVCEKCGRYIKIEPKKCIGCGDLK